MRTRQCRSFVLRCFVRVRSRRPTARGGVSSSAPPIKGTGTISGQVVVYSDGTRLGDAEQLRGITASSIASVRYYSASEAMTKWGSGHAGGAIEVITKR